MSRYGGVKTVETQRGQKNSELEIIMNTRNKGCVRKDMRKVLWSPVSFKE